MNEEQIKEQLKLSKKQNKKTRYNYIAQTFNQVNYVIKLEKYVIKILKENKQLKKQLQQKEDIINRANKYCYIINNSDYVYSQDEITLKLINILDNKGE